MKKTASLAAALVSTLIGLGSAVPALAANEQPSYRMYNPNSGEHFYTGNANEKQNLYNAGWWYEGISWYTPETGTPVYRVYNPNSTEHHYTTSANEQNALVRAGWRDEGTAFYSAQNAVPVYRLFNPKASNAGSHHYTTSQAEVQVLTSQGWRNEGIGWYAEKDGALLAAPDKLVVQAPAQPALPSQSVQQPAAPVQPTPSTYVANASTGKFHRPGCGSVSQMNPSNRRYLNLSYEQMVARGYSPCKRCKP